VYNPFGIKSGRGGTRPYLQVEVHGKNSHSGGFQAMVLALKRRRHRWWILSLLLTALALSIAWMSFRRRSEVVRLKTELEAQGECFTLEALGLEMGRTNDPTRAVLEAAAPYFEAVGEAEIDATQGWEYEPPRAEPPQVGWRQPFLYSPRQKILEWDLAAAVADRIRPELEPLHGVMRDPVPGPGVDPHLLDFGESEAPPR